MTTMRTECQRFGFPQTAEEAKAWRPTIQRLALAARVLVVARTRIEGAWCAYIDAVPGVNHERETELVLDRGAKVHEPLARVLFPMFEGVRYAR